MTMFYGPTVQSTVRPQEQSLARLPSTLQLTTGPNHRPDVM